MQEKHITDLYMLGNFIDTFALGHYARVLGAVEKKTQRMTAFKVMRPEHLDASGSPKWEAQAFVHEADLLVRLEVHPAPMRLYDCGYVKAEGEYPSEGRIRSFGKDVKAFREGLYPNVAERWRPYLTLEYLPRHHNLLYVMQPNEANQRRRLPTEEGLSLAEQFGELMRVAHAANIVYLDHKLEHLYWDGQTLRVIDWNSSKLIAGGGQALDQQIQKDIHNLCVGVLYSVFTGLSPQRGGLRPQPAGQREVDERYADVTTLDFTVEPTLSREIIRLLQKGARQDYRHVDTFLADLRDAAVSFGWIPMEQTADGTLRKAHQHMVDGLLKLRQGTDLVRDARELFLEAVILEDINEDLENELRRLLKDVNDFLNARAIP